MDQVFISGEPLIGLHDTASNTTTTSSPRYCFDNIWNEREARFEPCFLPVVASVPALVVILILIFQIACLGIRSRPTWTRPFVEETAETVPRRRWSIIAVISLITSAMGLTIQLVVASTTYFAEETLAPALSWFAAIALLLIHRPRTVPYSVLTILILQALVYGILIGTNDGSDLERNFEIAALTLSLLGTFVLLLMPLRDPSTSAKDISAPMTEPTSTLRSPEDSLTLWQFMTVAWMSPLQQIGRKRKLEDEDVWQLPYEFQHQRLHDNFRLLKGTVIQRLLRANAIDICILTILGLLELVMQYASPVLLQLLLSSMEDIDAPKRSAVTYAALAMAIRIIAAQSGVFSLWFGRRCYERSRGEMITMLYEKTLDRKISFGEQPKTKDDDTNGALNGNANGHVSDNEPQSKEKPPIWRQTLQKMKAVFKRKNETEPVKEPASMGKILNLMRNDVYEVAQRFWEFQAIFQKPLSVVFSVTLVVWFLGWPSLIAVFAMLLAQCLNFLLAKIMVHYEKKRRSATDSKLQVITQFVEAIRHLRWYGWQGSWLTQIMTARQKELTLRIITNLWNLSIAFVNTLSLDLTPSIAFFAYTVIAKKPLRVDIAFPAMQLFSLLTMALRDLPQLIIVLINAYVAVGRIEDFMAEPDKQEMNTEALQSQEMELLHATFAWPGLTEPVLKNINISFLLNLNVVFGEVASGKTALLQGLLGELDMLEGQLMRPPGPIAYCAQSPWLQSMSIRENILFGAAYQDRRYKLTLQACELTRDLAEFNGGDLSMVGENGIGLSGGQRARIALARAVYSNAEILLLDDPLSALDQNTAERIVRNLFASTKSLVWSKTVILVTHRTDLVLHHAAQVVEVQHGNASIVSNDDSLRNAALQRVDSTPVKDDGQSQQVEQRNAAAVPDKFVEEEHRASGGVKASVYWRFIKAGKLRWWVLLILVLAVYRVAAVFEAWYLKTWGEAYRAKTTSHFLVRDVSVSRIRTPLDDLPPPDDNIKPWLLGFFLIGLYKSLSFVMFQGVVMVITYVSGKTLFASIMGKVAGATFRFYDVTPVGRLMNRMTSDMGVIDGNISMQLQAVVWLSISWISAMVVIGSVTPTFLVFAVLLTTAFILIFRHFIPTSQSLRRLEMVSLTPLMSNFGSLLNGLSTVRAFQVQQQFQDRVVRVVDTFQKMDHFYWSLQAWLMYRYDVLSAISTFLITILALATNVSAGLTAFVLLAANKLVQSTHGLCKQYGQLQMEFVSVERVIELLDLEQEPKGDISPPAWWPSYRGDIVFKDVMIRYAPHLPQALAGISFTVKGGSKTAVIGRTGSGKSTLALAMLATVVPEAGQILVDNIDLAEVDKQLLRTRVTFVAQDPVLFPGTIRHNLDPLEYFTDEACELVLRRVCERHGWTLDTKIEAGGRNLSQGQRQLVGLARAVLRRSAIIILDEATASIDQDTAMQIQRVMVEDMRESTVITIAHRLSAALSADYFICLGNGRIDRQGSLDEVMRTGVEQMMTGRNSTDVDVDDRS